MDVISAIAALLRPVAATGSFNPLCWESSAVVTGADCGLI
jgi:hypothetical protein